MTFALATVAASGTSVAPSAPVPDNCHTVLVYNPSTTVTVLVGIATAPAPLTAGTNATPVPPGAQITLGVGAFSARGTLDLVFDSVGGAVSPVLTYLTQFGST